MQRLEMKHFVPTTTAFMGVVYLACAALTLAAPGALMAVANLAAHAVDFSPAASMPTAAELVAGFLVTIILSSILSAFFAWLWNRMSTLTEVKK